MLLVIWKLYGDERAVNAIARNVATRNRLPAERSAAFVDRTMGAEAAGGGANRPDVARGSIGLDG